MRVNGVEYDTWEWRFRIGDRIRHDDMTYDILDRKAVPDDQGVTAFLYTIRSRHGVVRIVRNYILNLEASRAGVTCAKNQRYRKQEAAYMQQLWAQSDRGV